ncbi:MAG: STAS-like domain-containing protein [Candidatus Roizmanbacteria bacterium]
MKKATITIEKHTGSFAENKDKAKQLRIRHIIPALSEGKGVILDFAGVSGTTQSFIHALIAQPIRQFGDNALENLEYKNCSDIVKEVIKTVYEYMQESLNNEDET